MSLARGIAAADGATVADLPATLGSYTLLTKLAQGGMATVYVGRKHGVAGFERLVAVKCCLPHLRDDEEFVTMFLDEARLAARIHHPNVVATLDVGRSEVLYLVMDYVEGDSLVTLLRHASQREAVLHSAESWQRDRRVAFVVLQAGSASYAGEVACSGGADLIPPAHRRFHKSAD